MSELTFEVTQEHDGGLVAECLTESIVTEANDWEDLRFKVQDVVRAFYFDAPEKIPQTIRFRIWKPSPELTKTISAPPRNS